MAEVHSADICPITPGTSETVARDIIVATNPFFKKRDFFCDLMKDLRLGFFRRNEEASGLTQVSSGAPNTRYGFIRYYISQGNLPSPPGAPLARQGIKNTEISD